MKLSHTQKKKWKNEVYLYVPLSRIHDLFLISRLKLTGTFASLSLLTKDKNGLYSAFVFKRIYVMTSKIAFIQP